MRGAKIARLLGAAILLGLLGSEFAKAGDAPPVAPEPVSLPDKPADLAAEALKGRANYRALATAEAKADGLPPEIADSVMAVESGYNPAAIGGAGEIGLMQVLPSTARMLGFAGSDSDLAVPQTNIHYGVEYLAEAWRLSGGDLCTTVMKYRAGHGETRFSYQSVDYCFAVRRQLSARGFPVTGEVPVATFGERGGGGGCHRRCLASALGTRVNFAALNSQLSTLVAQVRGEKR
ncbi:MAG TPA: transglycosylase SLT domain-containing protein [Methylovirgula sp.]|nr:transglycosylase SLT domain-containing protein [Methylovirgula sp.]